MEAAKGLTKLDELVHLGPPSARVFQRFVRAYFKNYGRDFPWRRTRDPYAVLVSEVMLQQTQTERVVPKYREFLKRFPNLKSLGAASRSEVVQAWLGLGYYRRALFLHKAAQQVCSQHRGKLPRSEEELRMLPGVGAYTAAAVAAFAYDLPAVMVETNIRTVYLHVYFSKSESVSDKEIEVKVGETLDMKNPREWFYGLMDLGAEIKRCRRGISRRSKHYAKQSSFEGSFRQVRAAVLRMVSDRGRIRRSDLLKRLSYDAEKVIQALASLTAEGFLSVTRQGVVTITR